MIFFWLYNTLASFDSYINKILAKKIDIYVIFYSDDIFMDIEDLSQDQMKVMRLMIDIM